MKMNSPVSSL